MATRVSEIPDRPSLPLGGAIGGPGGEFTGVGGLSGDGGGAGFSSPNKD